MAEYNPFELKIFKELAHKGLREVQFIKGYQ
jgi:hypothetical protein